MQLLESVIWRVLEIHHAVCSPAAASILERIARQVREGIRCQAPGDTAASAQMEQ